MWSSVAEVRLPHPRLLALLTALALAAAACSASDGTPSAAESPAVSEGADSSAEGGSASLLDISAPAADGTTIDLADYAGQDLMLWFWAPW